MTYINSLGIVKMCTQTTADIYRNVTGSGLALIYSGLDCSYVMPYEFFDADANFEIRPNWKPYDFVQCFTLSSGIMNGDEAIIDSIAYDVRDVNVWKDPTYYHVQLEIIR